MELNTDNAPQPFLKWPGGKRWATTHIRKAIGTKISGRYFEPFLGGGAFFFDLSPDSAVLSDINGDLINTYVQVRDNPKQILQGIREIPVTKESYYLIRSSIQECPIARAIRFLFLNRTCFGGMYRLNRRGEFNVPYGGGDRTPRTLWERGLIDTASKVLRSATLRTCDFEASIDDAIQGDLVFCDPTYTTTHNENGFQRYNETVFCWDDQIRLAEAAKRAASRGAAVIISNARHEAVRNLYPDASFTVLSRHSRMSRNPKHRRVIEEYLIVL